MAFGRSESEGDRTRGRGMGTPPPPPPPPRRSPHAYLRATAPRGPRPACRAPEGRLLLRGGRRPEGARGTELESGSDATPSPHVCLVLNLGCQTAACC